MGKIVLEDFNDGNGYYKINLAYLNKEQVEEIENLVAKWKPTDEDIKSCIRMCLTDANEQRFKDYGTNLKDCLTLLEKQKEPPFVKDVVLGYPGHYFYDGERMHFCGNPAMEEKQKEQKPLTTEETELNSIAFLEQMGYTCIPPRKEQKPAEPRKRNKPKESWLSKAKYEIEHADELLIQRQEELREIRELKKQEQHPSSKFQSGDWVVYDGPLGHAILQVKNVVDGRYTFVDNESTLLVEDSDKFLRPLTPKDVEKPAEWSEEDEKIAKEIEEELWYPGDFPDYPSKEENELYDDCQRRLNWLKSLPERFNLQPKEERSEEDEATIGTLINYFEGDALDCSTDEMIRRIRALRPSWKPSEEQMGALNYAYCELFKRGDIGHNILGPLQKLCDELRNFNHEIH